MVNCVGIFPELKHARNMLLLLPVRSPPPFFFSCCLLSARKLFYNSFFLQLQATESSKEEEEEEEGERTTALVVASTPPPNEQAWEQREGSSPGLDEEQQQQQQQHAYYQPHVLVKEETEAGAVAMAAGGPLYTPLERAEFSCNVCSKRFRIKSDMQRHLRVHTGEKPFKCFYCDFSSAMKVNLKNHCLKRHQLNKDAFSELAKQHFKGLF